MNPGSLDHNNETLTHTVSALIIGNELLSGKVEEENMNFLIHELRLLGVRLNSIHLLQDDVEVLSQYIKTESRNNDFVITSGGLGPTHDDVTMESVAEAFDVALTHSEAYEQTLQDIYGEPLSDSVRNMAMLPDGIELYGTDELDIPAAGFRNVFILPGEPKLFRSKFQAIKPEIKTNTRFYCQKIYVNLKESDMAEDLEELQNSHPDVEIGSYPSPWNDEYKELITIESTGEYAVEKAAEDLLQKIPVEHVVKREEE